MEQPDNTIPLHGLDAANAQSDADVDDIPTASQGANTNNPSPGPQQLPPQPEHTPAFHQRREDRQPTPPLPTAAAKGVTIQGDPQDRDLQCRRQLFDACKGELFHTLTRKENNTAPKTCVLNIATLQHISLSDIQNDLALYTAEMYRTSQTVTYMPGAESLGQLLNLYCEGVRNLDFMTECALRGYENDPFLLKSSRALERQTMEATGLIPDHVLPAGLLPLPQDHGYPKFRKMGRNAANKAAREKQRLMRFAMAATGGFFLVVPVIIMATVPGLISSLVTTCVSVLVFAGLMAWRIELSPNEVLGTTAGYAAVLVVFVGTSLPLQR